MIRRLIVLTCLMILIPGANAFATVSATNGILDLYVEDGASDIGTYTVATGAAFPFPGENIFFGGASGSPWTTYLTVKSYTTQTDYVSRSGSPSDPGYDVRSLDNFPFSVTPIGPVGSPTGYTTTWYNITDSSGRDDLQIEQVTNIEGTTLLDSSVRVTTTVTNVSNIPSTRIGIRYEWDYTVDGSDDSRIKRYNPTDPDFTSIFFQQPPPPLSEYYEMINGLPFSIFATITGPTSINPPPTPPYV